MFIRDLVCACGQRRCHIEPERLGSLEVDDELYLLACSMDKSAAFSP